MKFIKTSISIGLLVSCLLVGFVYAIEVPINQTINSKSWTPISLGPDQTCSSYAFQARDDTVFKVSATPDGAKYFTIKEGAAISLEKLHGIPGATLFYAQTVSGTTEVEVFILIK
jgi:hypothetical protein